MSKENKEQQIDQLLRGIYRMCINRDDCNGCPFYITKCTFEEPRPSTWFDEETIVVVEAPAAKTEQPVVEETPEQIEEPVAEKAAPEAVGMQKKDDNSTGTWLVSTAQGGVFTKYVFICSKCGYKKESLFSITPMTVCPECEKKKNAET